MVQKYKKMNVLKIFFKSIWLYSRNFFTYSEIMLFPVIGIVLGLVLVLVPAILFSEYTNKILNFMGNNSILAVASLAIIVTPGFILFFKAFWDYLVCFVSLNTITLHIMNANNTYDLKEYVNRVNSRSKDYATLLTVLASIWIIGLLAPLSVLSLGLSGVANLILLSLAYLIVTLILSIASYYLSLSYQVFAFETLSVVSTLRRSMELVEKNFFRTVILSILVGTLTGLILPNVMGNLVLASGIFDFATHFLEKTFTGFVSQSAEIVKIFSLIHVSPAEINAEFAKMFIFTNIATILSLFLLPIGCISYTLLYQDIIVRKK